MDALQDRSSVHRKSCVLFIKGGIMKETTKKAKIILCILLALFIAASATAVTMGVLYGKKAESAESYKTRVDRMYETAYYEAVDNMTDAERKLGKATALSKPTLQQEFLYDIWRQCNVAVTCLSRMAEEGEQAEAVINFLNKTGDYCYYLSRKAEADPIDERERNNLLKFKRIMSELNVSLAKAGEKTITDKGVDASVLSDMSAVGEAIKNSSDVDYPELIYDGPFSDGLKKRDAVFLKDKEEISEEKASENLKSYFKDAENVKMIGDNTSSIPAYVYSFNAFGAEGTAQISKAGGYLVEYSSYEKAVDPEYTVEECEESAKKFLREIGYEDMECVWTYNSDSIVYLNFAYSLRGVICYPDLIKVKVSAQTGRIVGMEAMNYMYNHKERTLATEKAQIVFSDKIAVEKTRECIIPTEWGTEIQCVEAKGECEGETYYVYYDVETGEETEVFVVADDLLS